MLTLGVDGCKAGWLAVAIESPGSCGGVPPDDAPGNVSIGGWLIRESITGLLDTRAARRAHRIVIDIPIGLSDGPPRACDRAARRRLGTRRASVFTPPMRAMLGMGSHAEASTYGRSVRAGGGLSIQAWNIAAKIAEVDAAMTPAMQARMREGHPEVAFARLAGAPMTHSKRRAAGRAERLAVLAAHGLEAAGVLAAVTAERPRRAAADDALDACVLALTARDVAAGRALVLGGERDARGLAMEILG